MTEGGPCAPGCAVCGDALARMNTLPPRRVTAVGEGMLRAAYEEGRSLYRAQNPHVTRSQIEGNET